MTRTIAGISGNRVAAAAAIAFASASLLCGYEFIRSVSQSLYIEAYGAIRLPWVMTLAPVGTLLIIYGYGRLLSWLGAKRAIVLTSLLSAAAIIGCYMAILAGSRLATAVLYVFREAYIVLLVEQVWSFINSTLRSGEGRQLNGPICGIASLGAIAGGLFVRHLAVGTGSANLLVFAAASLIPTGLLAAVAYHAGGEPMPAPEEAGGKQGHLGLRGFFGSRLLTGLALLIVSTQVVSAVLDIQLSRFVEVSIPVRDERTRWFGGFYAALNVGAAFLQFIGAPLLLQFGSVRAAHIGIPLLHLALCAASIFFPSLRTAAAAYFAFKAIDYSLFRAAKELFYVPLSFDARYRAKQLIDAFGYRLAKGGASGSLALAGRFVVLPIVSLPVIAVAALMVWLPLAIRLTAPGFGAEKTDAAR